MTGIAEARFDAAERLLRLTFAGDVDSAQYLDCMLGWLNDAPDAAGCGWLYDLRDYRGTVTHDDVNRFARAYDAAVGTADAGAMSVFVTPDPGFRFWLQACAHAFRRRRLIMADTVPEAEGILGLREGGAPADRIARAASL